MWQYFFLTESFQNSLIPSQPIRIFLQQLGMAIFFPVEFRTGILVFGMFDGIPPQTKTKTNLPVKPYSRLVKGRWVPSPSITGGPAVGPGEGGVAVGDEHLLGLRPLGPVRPRPPSPHTPLPPLPTIRVLPVGPFSIRP